MTPFVSVWMLAYNHEKFITKAIDSVITQKTNFDFHLFIGEDCSKDRTREICINYAAKYPAQITLLLNETNNLKTNGYNTYSACLNSGAKYVALLEGDDYWTDFNKIQKQADFLENNPQYSMCFTDSIIINDENKVIKEERVPFDRKHDLKQEDILSGYCPPGNTALIKAELLKKYLPYLDGSLNGDYFLFSLFANHGPAAYLDFNSAAYRVHNNGIWATKDEDYRLINYIKVNRKVSEFVQPQNKSIALNNIQKSYNSLAKRNSEEQFTDKTYWTPQTQMLRAIRDVVTSIEGTPVTALSIDKNPTVEQTLLRKWPELEISYARWPEYDAQNLHQFKDETFDIVFSHQVLEHIPKPWIAAKELVRVLKKGGIGIHTTCAYNPRHGYPNFKDYYRFLPDGLEQLFDGVTVWEKNGWGSKQALIYNLAIDDGNGALGGRRFVEAMAKQNDIDYPWHTWIVFQKNQE